MNYPTSIRLQTFFSLFFILAFSIVSYGQDNPYSTWAEQEIPISYQNIKDVVEAEFGTEDPGQNAYMIELHCRSLNLIFVEMNEDNANWDEFAMALEKHSKAEGRERGQNWWEWPKTDWINVESAYRFLLENTKGN